MMIATLLEPELERIKDAIDELAPIADAYEIRFDACPRPPDPAAIRSMTDRVLVGTVRRPADGGQFVGPEEERLRILERCLESGFQYVDVEGPTMVPAPDERLIRSRHEFRGTPSLGSILRLADETGRNGAVFKFAAKTQSFGDQLVLLQACRSLRGQSRPFAIMGLGEFPRALSHVLGARFVYGGGRTNAPGQPALAEIRATLEHWGNPGPAEDLFLVVGDPIAQSLSPRMHNAAFREQKADASYGALRVSTSLDLQMLLERAADLGIRGLSVTTPLKDAAFQLVKTRSPEAERARAVNAVRFDGEDEVGHNTDGLGARIVITRMVAPGAHVLVAGTGGAARAIAASLAGFDVTVAGRNDDKLRQVAHELGVATTTLAGAGVSLDEFDVVVNATRVGEPLPINGYGGALFDLHYGTEATPWQLRAKESGSPFAGGRELLLEQGVLAYEFWTGRKAPRETMATSLGVAL